ncbi:MAG: EAL domain-containing protein [Pseudomonadota bacterium]
MGRDPRGLWIRYVAAVSLILALLLGSHLVAMSAVHASRDDAEIVNVSGRQRMLSQRILYLADRYAEAPDPDVAIRLAASIQLFETAHQHLASLDRLSAESRDLYFGEAALDRRSRDYVRLARLILFHTPSPEAAEALFQLREQGLDRLLTTLNEAVLAFERSARGNSDRISSIQNLALYLAIAVLALESVLIFRPAQRMVRRALDDLERRNAELDAARVEAQQKNDALAQAADALSRNALHDALTGLGNRVKLQQDLSRMLPESHALGRRVAVLHVDLDRFKEVNDTLGHAAGDEVLRQVSARMRRRIRDTDVMARVGGDEFVIALETPDEGGEEAVRWVAEDLISAARQPVIHDGAECNVGASVGYVFSERGDDDPSALIANADIALYEAKRGGRGRACAFGEEMRADLDRRRRVLQGLERALEEQRFVAWYQPIASLDDGRLLGVEALARWRRSDGSLSAPAEFVDLAEEVGAIERIDRLVAEAALKDIAALRAAGAPAPGLSLNVSTRTLRDADFADRLAALARAQGIQPSDVTIELMEATLAGDDANPTVAAIAAVSERGFRTAIDDFGAGCASMANLASLDLSGLKIHRSLIAEMERPREAQIVSAIIGLARGLDLEVTAQGVETAAQHRELKRLGCAAVQGFALGRPMPAEALGRWLRDYGAAPLSAPA